MCSRFGCASMTPFVLSHSLFFSWLHPHLNLDSTPACSYVPLLPLFSILPLFSMITQSPRHVVNVVTSLKTQELRGSSRNAPWGLLPSGWPNLPHCLPSTLHSGLWCPHIPTISKTLMTMLVIVLCSSLGRAGCALFFPALPFRECPLVV